MTSRNPRGVGNVDAHLGDRLREARLAQGLSQTSLADILGITFQQIQKYEKGKNRISASRLYEIALALQLPITFFFEGTKLPQPARSKRAAR